MADSLQEFLVKLKYQSEGREGYLSGIKGAESSVMRLGKALVAGGTALGVFFGKYAERMEQVGFVARRTGAHVKNLMALEQAGASLGSSAEGAKDSLENLAAFMRNTPGASSWLHALGVQTKDAKGHALDTVQVMKNLGGVFRKMPVWQSHAYAQVLGISDHMQLAMRDKNFSGLIDKFKKPLTGAHLDKTASVANQAMIAGRVLSMKKEATESKIALPVMQAFVKADASTGGLSTDLLGLAKALGEVSVGAMLFKGILKTMFGSSVAEGVAGKAGGSVAGETAGKMGKILRFLPWLGRLTAIGGAAIAGVEAGKALDKIPAVHQLSGEVAKGVQDELKKVGSMPILGPMLKKLDLIGPGGSDIVRARTDARTAAPATVHNTHVTIHVQGGKDPHETAKKVKEELRMAVHNSSMVTH